jgi:DNA gyrase inhibitor GyrI
MKIENFPNYRLAYIRSTGEYGVKNKETMEKLKNWAKEKSLFNKDAIIFGIAQDNPKIIPSENCRYDACITISDKIKIDSNVEECEYIGGKYAIFKIIHTSEEIQKAYLKIFSTIEKKGIKVDNKPIIEKYTLEMVEKNLCEICVPIV